MTREAKIGMLTGLGVIILIGVLLSDYLSGAVRATSPTGRMAELPMGAAYRQEVTEPVGVPGMARSDAPTNTNLPANPATPIATGSPNMPQLPQTGNDVSSRTDTAAATGVTPGQPVSPVPAGQVRMDSPLGESSVPTLQLADTNNGSGEQAVYVPGNPKPAVTPGKLTFTDQPATPSPAVKGQEYVVAPGDTLMKIASKFYKSSKNEAVQRIVAANPKLLKDDKTMLIAGKKLLIPTLPAIPKPTASVTAMAPQTNRKKDSNVVIHQPGGVGGAVATKSTTPPDAPASPPQKTAATFYIVQAGDTLEKIAKKASPSNITATIKKIESLNSITDPTTLKIGTKLKLPTP